MRCLATLALAPLLVMGGCALETEDETDDHGDLTGDDPALDSGPTDDGKDDSATALPLRFLPGELILPSASIRTEVRKVFRTEEALESALGIDNPGIDFSREWAVFYTPGTARTDLAPGFMARIDTVRVSSTALTIMVTTSLEQNGNCATRRSRPFLLVAVPRPASPPPYTRYYRADRTRACPTDVTYLDGVAFTAEQLAASLRAANLASADQLADSGIAGSPRSIILGGRIWTSLSLLSSRAGIGEITMARLRTMGEQFP